MRITRKTVGLALALVLCVTAGRADEKKQAGESCGNHGTSVEFLDTPSEAARKAIKEEKLVFVLHVSGNFEDPRFT
jgi:hypothetical protein